MAFQNPLNWPVGWQRGKKQYVPPFNANYSRTMKELEHYTNVLQMSNVTITTDQKVLFSGGVSIAKNATPNDTGVAMYFTRKNEQYCIPCDKFKTVIGNLRAIGLTLDYIARMERYGTAEIVNAALSGFRALPAQASPDSNVLQPWYDVLGVSPNADVETVKAVYRSAVKRYHPEGKEPNDKRYQAVLQAWNDYKSQKGL